MMSYKKKLDFLVRNNKGKILLPEIIYKLKCIIGEKLYQEIKFLPLEESEILRNRFLEVFKEGKKVIVTEHLDKIDFFIKNDQSTINFITSNGYLFTSVSDKIGCIEISFKIFQDFFKNLVGLDRENMCFFHKNEQNFIFVDFFEDTSAGKVISYELITN